jgi:hypothetical protein
MFLIRHKTPIKRTVKLKQHLKSTTRCYSDKLSAPEVDINFTSGYHSCLGPVEITKSLLSGEF